VSDPCVTIRGLLSDGCAVETKRTGHRGRSPLWFVPLLALRTSNCYSTHHTVSQFTLMAQIRKDHRFDFHRAADVKSARKLYDYFYHRVRDLYHSEQVKTGVFQAMMEVELRNDGPVGLDYRSLQLPL
jgi:hypothetical protein